MWITLYIVVHICNTKVTFNNHNKILRRYLTSYVPSKVFDFILLIENLGVYHESRPKGITFGGN